MLRLARKTFVIVPGRDHEIAKLEQFVISLANVRDHDQSINRDRASEGNRLNSPIVSYFERNCDAKKALALSE